MFKMVKDWIKLKLSHHKWIKIKIKIYYKFDTNAQFKFNFLYKTYKSFNYLIINIWLIRFYIKYSI